MTQDGFCWVPILDADSQLSNFGIVEDQYQYPDLVRPPNMNKGVYGIRISKVKHHVSYIYIASVVTERIAPSTILVTGDVSCI